MADQVGAQEAAALNALEAAFFHGAELSAILLLAPAATVALRTAALPRWWAAVSILLAVWLVNRADRLGRRPRPDFPPEPSSPA